MSEELLEIRRLYWWSFALRFGVGVLALCLTTLFQVPLLEDALYYDQLAAEIAADWLDGRSSAWLQRATQPGAEQAWVNVVAIAAVYWATGGVRLTGLVLALYAALTSYTPVLTYRITRRLGGSPVAARFAGRLVAFSPCFAFWSGALYKEGIILLLINLAVYLTLRLQSRWTMGSGVLIALCIPLLYGLRTYMAVLVAVSVVGGLMLARSPRRRAEAAAVGVLRQTVVVAALVSALVAMGLAERLRHQAPSDVEGVLQRVSTAREELASAAASGYLPGADVSTPERALAFLPGGVLHFLAVPLPWQLGSMRQNLVIPETSFWILLYPLVGLGIATALRRNFQGGAMLLGLSLAICVFYGLMVGNVGTAYRLRAQVWLLWAVFAGWGWERWRGRGTRRRAPALGARLHAPLLP